MRTGCLRRGRSIVAVALAVVVVGACGYRGEPRSVSASGDGLGMSSGSSTAEDGGAMGLTDAENGGAGSSIVGGATTGGAGGAAGGAAVAGGGAGGGTVTSPTGGTRPARIPAGRGVPGVTDDKIQIGVYTADAGTGNAVMGAVTGGSANSEDPDRFFKEVIAEVNKKGVAGRKLEPVWHFVDYNQYANSSARQSEHQRMCSAWTEDNKVFAISGAGMMEDMIIDCAARAKTTIVMSGYQPPISKQRFDAIVPYWYSPNGMLTDTRESSVVRFLHANGYFTPGAKIGLVVEDTPYIRAGVDRGLKPTLSALGLKAEVEIVYPDVIESPWSTYILTLFQRGVTHVILSATTGGTLPGLFMTRAANEQGYRPQWGLGSDHTPDRLVNNPSSPEQLANVWAAGWMPAYDLGVSAPVGSPNDQRCRDIQARVSYTSTTSNTGNAHSFCEVLFFLQAALDHADELSPQGMAQGAARLATSYPSALTVDGRTAFGSRDHEGPSVARLVRYDSGAKRFTYTTGPQPLTAS